MRNFSPVTKMRKGAKILGMSYGAKFEKQNNHGETQSRNCHIYHGFLDACSCLVTAAKWDTNDMNKTADRPKLCYTPLQGMRSWKHSSPVTEIPVGKTEISATEPGRPHMNTSKFLQGTLSCGVISETGLILRDPMVYLLRYGHSLKSNKCNAYPVFPKTTTTTTT